MFSWPGLFPGQWWLLPVHWVLHLHICLLGIFIPVTSVKCSKALLLVLFIYGIWQFPLRASFIFPPPPPPKSLQSCPTLCDPIDGSPPGSPIPGIRQARLLQWGSHSLLLWIFLTQRWNPGLLHCRQILYGLSHQGSSNAGGADSVPGGGTKITYTFQRAPLPKKSHPPFPSFSLNCG